MTTIPKKPFILVDGSSYLYRAFHALPPLMNSKGLPTGAVYGFINMLRKLLKDYPSNHVAVVFDAKGKTFRDDIYPEYKAHRPPMPDELRSQIQPIHDWVNAMGIPEITIEGVEADDVIGTLAIQAEKEGLHTLISTGDKDLAQLVNEHVTLINTMSGMISDPDGVKEKFGVPPELIIDYLTLIGDTSDNIPGVNKVGPKTAVKWLNEYGSLDEITKRADEFKGKVGEYLRESLDHLPMSHELITIKKDVELKQAPKDLTIKEKDANRLIEIYTDLEFKSFLSEILENSGETEKEKGNYKSILTLNNFNEWYEKIEKAEVFAFDTETTSINYIDAKVVGMSFAVEEGEAVYIPFSHDYEEAPNQLSPDFVLKKLKPILESSEHKKLGHHLKYDMNVLVNHDINLAGIEYDSMIESHLVQSSGLNHKLDTLSLKYLGHKAIAFEDVAGKGKDQLTFNQVPIEQATNYAAEDADLTLKLHNILWPKVSEDKGLKQIFTEIEIPLIPVLSRIERRGVLIDAKKLNEQSKRLEKRLDELKKEVYKLAKQEFNLDSPKQLQEILFDKLGLPIIKKTPKGQPSTAEPVLQELALDYPLPKLIIEHRSLSKLKSTYTDKLPEQINAKTGRVHTSYHQAGTSTGRLASSDPNLQNIPIRTEEGRRVRQAFIAPKGYKLVSLDYSQIELRIMAHISQDKGLLKAFENGWDVHAATAAEVFGKEIDDVTDNERRNAKAINFGLIYGMSAFGLAKQIGADRKSAQEYIDIYFHRYPGVKKYMDDIKETAHKNGYVETMSGRKLHLPEINAKNLMRQKAAERAAINAPMQGTAADVIKTAMIDIDQWLQKENNDTHMIMQVHDELVFEIPEKNVDAITKEIQNRMEGAVKLDVKLIAHVGIGNNWDEAH